MILIALSISCRRRDKDEDLYESVQSGFLSGITNGLVRHSDKIIKPLQSSAEAVARAYQVVTKGIGLRADHIILNNKFGGPNAVKKLEVIKEITSSSDFVGDTLNWLKKNPMAMGRLKLDQSGIKAAGKLAGNIGTKIINVLPFLSAAYNGYEAINRASDGDYFGASLKVANAAIAFIPGLTFTQSIIPNVINVVYDIWK